MHCLVLSNHCNLNILKLYTASWIKQYITKSSLRFLANLQFISFTNLTFFGLNKLINIKIMNC